MTTSAPPVARTGRPLLLWLVVGALTIALLALWTSAQPWSGRTTNGAQVLGTLSAASGLVGLLFFAITIVLSARFAVVENLIGGLDKVYRQHHLLGSLSFTLLLVHPPLLAWKYAQISLERSAHLMGPSTRWPLVAGQVALYAMIPALYATLFLTVRHQTLVALQRMLGLLFLPAAYHSLFTGGDTVRSMPLRLAVAGICLAATVALAKHTVFGRSLDRHRRFTVESIAHVGEDLAELWLRPVDQELSFVPGQFAYLRFPQSGEVTSEAHPFSIATAPGQGRIRFMVKELGDWTRTIEGITAGALAVVEGPYGRFSHRFFRGRSQLWVAGGIGITPFLSMAGSLAPTGCPYDVDLVWCYPDRRSAVALDELSALAAERPHLRVHPRSDEDHPLPTADVLSDVCASSGGAALNRREILLCGPAPMRDALRSQLISAGVDRRRIHDEEFRYS